MTGLLVKHFGYSSLKDWQILIIRAALEGKKLSCHPTYGLRGKPTLSASVPHHWKDNIGAHTNH